MKRSGQASYRDGSRQGSARVTTLVVLAFVVGLGGGYWFFQSRRPNLPPAGVETGKNEKLSETTTTVLQGLRSPVEIRFYSLLDPATVSESTRTLSARIEQLLAHYEREANGMIRLVQIDSMSRSNAEAAASDGIQPFNLDKGSACFLGMAVMHSQRVESLPYLSPEWEPALEWDLSRAIVRVTTAPPTPPAAAVSGSKPVSPEELRRIIPDLASVSAEQGTRLLREGALREFAEAAKEMERQVAVAQQRLGEAQASGVNEDRQSALGELQRVQAEHAENLKRIARVLEERIAALERIKGVSRQPVGSSEVRTDNSRR